MAEESVVASEYRCPGAAYPISRAVHLGRLARFYPPCRGCSHREDCRPLSPRQKRRLMEVQRRAEPHRLFHSEGVAGVYWNQLTLLEARRLATAMGLWLQQRPDSATPPTVLVAGDGRPLTPELVSAVVEGLRWTGCHTVEIPAATAACAALAVGHAACDGGILVGNPTGNVQTVGLKFWGPEGRPLSLAGELEAVERIFQQDVDRPARRMGSLRRFQAELPYLEELVENYHGLRPLRLVLRTNCRPLGRHLESLLAPTACECLDCQSTEGRLAEQVRQEGAHFGVNVEDDGECCVAYDERGLAVEPARLAALAIEELSIEQPEAVVVLDPAIAGPLVQHFGRRVQPVVCVSPCRAEMRQVLEQQAAIFGGDATGRFWYRLSPSCWAADALRTLTLLMKHLSRSDRPLSTVLDGLASGD